MSNITDKEINYQFDNFTNYLIPFGSMDIRSAVTTSMEAGFNGKWAGEQVEEFMEQTEVALTDIDPCYCVYQSILEIARAEIEEITDHDFVNDQPEICTYGNFMCTSYDYEQEAIDRLIEVLQENNIKEDDFSEATIWFLNEVNITKDEYEY